MSPTQTSICRLVAGLALRVVCPQLFAQNHQVISTRHATQLIVEGVLKSFREFSRLRLVDASTREDALEAKLVD